ncbi:MAG: VOC family protein [Ardenticatenaceae bacterium]|nr:VOC family protein [Ardenticatenaceae bacterium]
MATKIHHLGIAVKDLDAMVTFYQQQLGLEMVQTVAWEELGLKAAVLKVGEVLVELIEPVAPKGSVAESLERLVKAQDGGVHHLALEVDDLAGTVERLRTAGVPLLDQEPRQAAGGQIAWLQEEAASGTLIELCQAGYRIM